MKAADLSKASTGRELTVQECTDLKASGIELLIVDLFDGAEQNSYANATLINANLAGLHTAGYTALTPSQSGSYAVSMALATLIPSVADLLTFLSIDVELDGLTTDQINGALIETVGRKHRPCIYTAYWYWTSRLGNPNFYRAVPLWNAVYDNDPDVDFSKLPYGGWTEDKLVGEQYQGTTTVPGSSPAYDVDYSFFKDEWVLSGPGTQNGLAALRQAWETDMEDTIHGAVSLHQEAASSVRLAVFGEAQKLKAQKWATLIGSK